MINDNDFIIIIFSLQSITKMIVKKFQKVPNLTKNILFVSKVFFEIGFWTFLKMSKFGKWKKVLEKPVFFELLVSMV
jgi:hypothetical protein